MNLFSKLGVLLVILCFTQKLSAQGPPITADKPIMLGSKTVLVKTLMETRINEASSVTNLPLIAHYLPTSNSLVAIHVPVYFDLENDSTSVVNLGDIQLMGKYQFYRKDQMGKTFRVVAKTIQNLPTGKKNELDGISTGFYNGYYSVVAGLETIKYGISNELGYKWTPQEEVDRLIHKLGFGLPLLKPTYPVKQINLYFEYEQSYFNNLSAYRLLYAQGIQYAIKRLTIEAAVQLPLIQSKKIPEQRIVSVLFGARYAF